MKKLNDQKKTKLKWEAWIKSGSPSKFEEE
jgi:hypothetical protein